MANKVRYLNRDLSWLRFNYRVLEEAKDKTVSLYERIKFLAIYSSNLGEFYKIRVASYRNLMHVPDEKKKNLAFEPEQILYAINRQVELYSIEFEDVFWTQIIPELEANNIILYQNHELNAEQKNFIDTFFFQEVLPYLQPVLLSKGNIFSFLQDNVIYLAVKLYKRNSKPKILSGKRKPRYAIVKLPTQHLLRFINLPKIGDKYYIIFLDDILRLKLSVLFPGFEIDSCYGIKLSRDADLIIDDEVPGDIMEKVRQSLTKRKTGDPARFLFDRTMPKDFLRLLMLIFHLDKDDLSPGGRYHNFSDFFNFPNPLSPNLEREILPTLQHRELEKNTSILETIKTKDVMLHFPYHSYDYVLRFLHQAAVDPKIEEIYCTQYRVATNSAIVNALIGAAQQGKKVTVFVEVKARFDEELNLRFAEEMKRAGIKILAGMPVIKVHAKSVLALRKPKDGVNRGYAFLSTGNFNEKTAKVYADHGFFTSNTQIINDLILFFKYLENRSLKPTFKHILVAQFNLGNELINKINREISNARLGLTAWIIIKANGIEHKEMIDKLYEASIAGVKIDMIIRGPCSLIPDQEYSKNISIIRIVDKYLEHARIYIFHNNGQNETYISSSDLMNRNLIRRIEMAVPIYDQEIKDELMDILQIQLSDNVKARKIGANYAQHKRDAGVTKNIRAQNEIYEYLKRKSLLLTENKLDAIT